MPRNGGAPKVVLSWGLGTESTAILLRWLEDPSSRDFDLADLLVVTAMTGDEFPDTRTLAEAHVLPRLRARGVRYVQVARAGRYAKDGFAVLSDSRGPARLFMEGKYRLSDELQAAGTVPTSGGIRKCSLKFKGFPIDGFLLGEVGPDAPYRHAMGFNRDEMRRVAKDDFYGGTKLKGRKAVYPLVEWGWSRADCEAYIKRVTGADWKKSCCSFCPFAAPKRDRATKARTWHVEGRYEAMPETGALAAWIEHLSLAMNPVMTLYAAGSVRAELAKAGNGAAVREFEARLEAAPHSLYRVRRAMKAPAQGVRSVERLRNGSRDGMLAELRATGAGLGIAPTFEGGVERVFVTRRAGGFPSVEEFYVAAPSAIDAKAFKGFEAKFAAAAEAVGALAAV